MPGPDPEPGLFLKNVAELVSDGPAGRFTCRVMRSNIDPAHICDSAVGGDSPITVLSGFRLPFAGRGIRLLPLHTFTD